MTKDTGFFTCKNICWIIGALLGFAIFLMISGFIGLIVGIIVAVGAAILLQKYLCAEVVDTRPAKGETTAASLSGNTASTAQASSDANTRDEVAASAASIPAAAMDGAPVPVEAATAPAAPVTAEKPAEAETPAEKPKAKKAAAKKPAAKKAPAEPATATAQAEPAAAASAPTGVSKKPRTLKAPRKAGADDLKQLKGVGPKLEQTLNGLGFWHFDQIAKWTADEIAWVDDNLSFKGRIERDGWVEQAKTLAEGGETAFSKKVKKGDVY